MKRSLALLILIVMAAVFLCVPSSAAGSWDDPVVTLSYVNNVFLPDVLSNISTRIDQAIDPVYQGIMTRIQSEYQTGLNRLDSNAMALSIYSDVLTQIGQLGGLEQYTSRFTPITLSKGDTLYGNIGTGITLLSGSAATVGTDYPVIDVSAGKEVTAGTSLSLRAYYMLAGSGNTGVTMLSDGQIAVDGVYRIQDAYKPRYTDLADALKTMNLFRGSNGAYELERGATRLEALIMLVRLIGEEDEALAYGTDHPFKDVPKWADDQADKIVAYAYAKGYTKGTSATAFSPNTIVTPEQYMTFLLRALGYVESADGSADFKWNESIEKALSVGLLMPSEAAAIQKTFLRDQVVYTSYYALFTATKNGFGRLIDTLQISGAVNFEAVNTAISGVTRVRPLT